MRRIWTIAMVVACLSLLAPEGRAQYSSPDAIRQLMRDVTYNEQHDKERDSYWSYRIQQKMGPQSFVKRQVETGEGPIFRILEEGGRPLTDEQEHKEETRLNNLLNSPSALSKNREDHLQDEARMQRMINLMPDAFLFEAQGAPNGDLMTLSFRPNPDFKPPTYEARVFHGLAGTFVINTRLKRMVDMRGSLINRVDFGYGLLGYIEKGGTFHIHRVQVCETHWKTDLVDVHVAGRVILLKSVSKDHYEARSQFVSVPTSISMNEAKQMLDQAAAGQEAASLKPVANRF